MNKFIGYAIAEIITELQEKGYDYEFFTDENNLVIAIEYNPNGKPYNYYADGNVDLEIEDGYCVAFACRYWD